MTAASGDRTGPKSGDKLADYRRRRDPSITPEPVPPKGGRRRGRATGAKTFVIQEHHARALHWDFRLERDGVLVSWAIPKGLPLDKKTNHLAVHTEDHPLEYASFAGTIPEGEYGGGTVSIWDSGTYDELKWSDREVMVVLHGRRIEGTYVLFATKDSPLGEGRGGDRSWMIHRMDDAPAGYSAPPRDLRPMLATLGTLPTERRGLGVRVQVGRHSCPDVRRRWPRPRRISERQRPHPLVPRAPQPGRAAGLSPGRPRR